MKLSVLVSVTTMLVSTIFSASDVITMHLFRAERHKRATAPVYASVSPSEMQGT